MSDFIVHYFVETVKILQRFKTIFKSQENDEFSSIFKEFYLYSPGLLQSNGDLEA